MSLIPEDHKVYFCEEGGCCFICVGRDNCKNYRLGFKLGDDNNDIITLNDDNLD